MKLFIGGESAVFTLVPVLQQIEVLQNRWIRTAAGSLGRFQVLDQDSLNV